MSLAIRLMEPYDFMAVVGLQRQAFPPPFPEDLLWTPDHLQHHVDQFPCGQHVAVLEGRVIGSASSCILAEHHWDQQSSWDETVGGFLLQAHCPSGTVLFGVDISVAEGHRGQGVGRALYQARFDLVRKMGLRRFGTACRMPDYKRQRPPGQSPIEYANNVVRGDLRDRTLTPLIRYGLRLIKVQENYMEDEESGDSAAFLEWTP